MNYRQVLEKVSFFPGPVFSNDIRCLNTYAQKLGPGEIAVDFGTGHGKSAIVLGLSNPDIKVYTFDKGRTSSHGKQANRQYYITEIVDRINTVGVKNVYFQIGNSLDIYSDWGKEIGLLNIDSDHTYETTKVEIARWEPFVKAGGAILFHDYKMCPGVKQAVSELVASSQRYQLSKYLGYTQPVTKS